ncbi:hypothetical protein CJU89_1050 [Yarrowia sp. B02]|nr:hypothetical protein CJU89_1050 [Yarrowia sp. B02]
MFLPVADQELVAQIRGLRDLAPDAQLAACRALKNEIIGHDEKKTRYLECDGVVVSLVQVLQEGPWTEELRTQAAVIIASFTAGCSPVVLNEFVRLGIHRVIVTAIVEANSHKVQYMSALLRTLAALLKVNDAVAHECIDDSPQLLKALSHHISVPSTPLPVVSLCTPLVPLLGRSRPGVQRLGEDLSEPLAARILLLTQQYLAQRDRIPSVYTEPLASAVFALSHVVRHSLAVKLLEGEVGTPGTNWSSGRLLQDLFLLLRAGDTQVRLAVCFLFSNLHLHMPASQQLEIARPLLPVLVPMLSGPEDTDPRVCKTLALLCRDHIDMATLAAEARVIELACALVTPRVLEIEPANHCNQLEELIADALLLVAAIGMHKDTFRARIVECGVLSHVIKIMRMKTPPAGDPRARAVRKMKISSCYLVRALSRSVSLLRTGFVDEEVVEGIIELLDETPSEPVNAEQDSMDQTEDGASPNIEDLEVKAAIMASMCNLILPFSPFKKNIFERGVLQSIIAGVNSDYTPLRLNSTWALRHAVLPPDNDDELIEEAMGLLTCKRLLALLVDPDIEVQEQAHELIRNLMMKQANFVEVFFSQVEAREFTQLLENKIDVIARQHTETVAENTATHSSSQIKLAKTVIEKRQVYTRMLIAIIYTLAHVAAGPEEFRFMLVEQESLLLKVAEFTDHRHYDVRTACAWLVINLTYVDNSNDRELREGAKRRARALAKLGYKEKLEARLRDPTLDVAERTKNALIALEWLLNEN